MFRNSIALVCSTLLLVSFQTACSRPSPQPSTPAQWQRLEAPNTAQQAMLQLGEMSRVMLAQGLMGALTAATAGGDFAGGVEACHTQAPAIAEQLQTAAGGFSVRVGRTSERLRNPANAAPAWVTAALAAPEPAGRYSNGATVGALTPIPTGAMCVNCHGAPAQLAPGVADAVARLYPEDRATGFAEGDLRGWFWVEVAASN